MLYGVDLARALSEAIEKKGVLDKDVAAAFGVKPPSVSEWKSLGRIHKKHLPTLLSYFGDVVGPEHWGLSVQSAQPEYAGAPKTIARTPVVGTARMGDNGFYDELCHPVGHGDGWIDGYSANKNAYALRVKGDSMHPAIRHGYFVVVNPGGQCVPTEYVAISMLDGRKMVKELVKETLTEVVIESVNGNHRQTLDKSDIEQMSPIAAVVSPSNWRMD